MILPIPSLEGSWVVTSIRGKTTLNKVTGTYVPLPYLELGMSPLILTVLNKDFKGGTAIPVKGC